MQAADSEAKVAQRHAVLTANFLHWSVNAINSNLQQSNVYTRDCIWSCSTNHAEKAITETLKYFNMIVCERAA